MDNGVLAVIVAALGGVVLIMALMFGVPMWKVWQQGLSGEAILNKAEQTRKVLIEQARAEKEAAVFRAEAIEIVGGAAQQYPEYRYQEFMGALGEAMQSGTIHQILYIPTEAMLPVMEGATR